MNDVNDAISRQAAIKAIEEEWDGCCSEYPATQIIYDTTEAIEKLPSIQPDKDKVSNLLYHIYSIQSPHLDMNGVIAKKYYCEELWKELFGKESELPRWMN